MKNLFEIIVLVTIVIGVALMIGESYNNECATTIEYSTQSYDTLAEEELNCDCMCDTCCDAIDREEDHPCDCNFSDVESFTQEEIAEMRLNN